ncbi:hypothetical protein BHE74_00030942 [Ensete ventricosum]|nr:hypothetical protein BHE74_00030942 [Ensete ventricosum]
MLYFVDFADPYLNTDAGTMSPFEHGEVFVLDDGGEVIRFPLAFYSRVETDFFIVQVDLDLGNYERFLDIRLTRDNNITTGKIYQVLLSWSLDKTKPTQHSVRGLRGLGLIPNLLACRCDKVSKKLYLLTPAFPGGFGDRGVQGKILAAKYARENNVPYLGICLGMQIAVIEFARSVMNLKEANSTEFDPVTTSPVVIFMPEVNPNMVAEFQKAGLAFVGKDETGRRMEIIELPAHPYFVGVQFHPEFKSRPGKPSAVFLGNA